MSNIKPCTEEHLDAILKIQEAVLKENKDGEKEQLLLITERDEFEDCLKKGLILGAFCNDQLIAYIAMSSGSKDSKFERLPEISQNAGHKKIAYIELVIVDNDFRGQGLQKELLRALEEYVSNKPEFGFMGAMASPDNEHSMRGFKACGFEDRGFVEPPPKYPRKLLFKILNK